jgi:endonuclease/exonuclease/phosphatase family metal-dependent hydrolase
MEIDYANLRQVANRLNGHVYALQEIGSPAALARVLDPSEYHFVMSSRYESGDEFRPPSERDIYTAFAFSKAVFPEPPNVSTLDALSLSHLAYNRRRDATESDPTRAGLVVEFHHNSHDIALLNVHLKSSCTRGNLTDVVENYFEPPNTSPAPEHVRYACRTQIAQLELIENWVEMQIGLGKKVMIMGDFNRGLNADNDAFWNDLNDGRPRDLVKGPAGQNDHCWYGHDSFKSDFIDFIVADSALLIEEEAGAISKPEGYLHYLGEDVMNHYLDREDANRLSDHCPVSLILHGD